MGSGSGSNHRLGITASSRRARVRTRPTERSWPVAQQKNSEVERHFFSASAAGDQARVQRWEALPAAGREHVVRKAEPAWSVNRVRGRADGDGQLRSMACRAVALSRRDVRPEWPGRSVGGFVRVHHASRYGNRGCACRAHGEEQAPSLPTVSGPHIYYSTSGSCAPAHDVGGCT